MSETADWAAGQLAAIENATEEDVDTLADEFIQDACDPGAYFGSCKPEWGEIVRLLGPLLDRRPDLEGTGLLELLDNLAVGPFLAEEPAGEECDALRRQVTGTLDRWRSRLENPEESPGSRCGALTVMSYYEPHGAAARAGAVELARSLPPRDEDWFEAFAAARRILSPGEEWSGLVRGLEMRIEVGEAFDARTNPPLPRPEVCVLVASLPRHDDAGRARIFERLRRFDARELTDEALHLPAPLRAEVMNRVVARINAESRWLELGGFAEIYYLLQAVFEHGPAEARYTARSGSVEYAPIRPPTRPPSHDVALLRPILDCSRLWETPNNLLRLFGLPETREGFSAWLSSGLSSSN